MAEVGVRDHGGYSTTATTLGAASADTGTSGAGLLASIILSPGSETVSTTSQAAATAHKTQLGTEINKAAMELAELAATLGAHNVAVAADGAAGAAGIAGTSTEF